MPRVLPILALLLLAALPARGQSGVAAGAEERARLAVAERAAALGAAEGADADALVVTDAHADPSTGLTFVYLAQTIGGVPVDVGRVVVGLGQDGAPFHVAGALVPGVAAARPQAPALSAAEAGVAAARAAAPGTAADGTDLVYVVEVEGRLRLAWRVLLPETAEADGPHRWRVDVDATTGAEIARTDLVLREGISEGDTPLSPVVPAAAPFLPERPSPVPLVPSAVAGSYRVYALPTESPAHAGDPAADLRTLAADPHDALASPYGWHDTDGVAGPEHTITRGNNVNAEPGPTMTPPRTPPDGGPGLAFDFPFDPALAPPANLDAGVTNAFYWLNVAHDVLYQYGFTEAAGNFQQNTYGRGGLGGDAVLAYVQDPFLTNGGTFGITPEGVSPTMRIGPWTYTAPPRDIAFDASVVVHEYAHGLSNRLVGGPTVLCLNGAEQPGEGWSDLVAILLTMRPGDTRYTPRGIAAYGTGQGPGATIRPAPYSTDFAVNPYTYGDTRTMLGTHAVGFVWATAVWEVVWDLIDAYGFSPDVYDADGTAGNQIALRLLVAGLKLTPCSPGFVDAREGIMAADRALYGGVHQALLWAAFARRGLGGGAIQGSSNVLTDNVEAFDIPLTYRAITVSPLRVDVVAQQSGRHTAIIEITNTAPPEALPVSFQVSLVLQPGARPNGSGAPDPHPPDAFGYRWLDTDDPGGPAPDFHDVTGSGAPLLFVSSSGAPDPDGGAAEVLLPFPFSFYGTAYTRLYAQADGLLTFTAPHPATRFNTYLPLPSAPNGLIAPFWDDLRCEAPCAAHTGLLPDGRFAIQFTRATVGAEAGSSGLTFQVLLSPDGTIEFQYAALSGALDGATVGIESGDGLDGLQAAYDVPYLRSDFALRFEAPNGWITAAPATGLVPPGTTVSLTLTLDAAGLTAGRHQAEVRITTNEAGLPVYTVPVTFDVPQRVDLAGPAGWRLLAVPVTGMTVGDLAAQNLVQGAPGLYPAEPPNLYGAYDGAGWPSAGPPVAVLSPGRGFAWYFFDEDRDPGGPSFSRALPITLFAPSNAVTLGSPVLVPLHANGDGLNLIGNPFEEDLYAGALTAWTRGGNLASAVAQTWDPVASSFQLTTTLGRLPAWQGLIVENATATAISFPRGIPPAPLGGSGVTFELEGATPDGAAVFDRAVALRLHATAAAGWDMQDATKLHPLSAAYVALAFEGTHDGRPVLKAQESRPLAFAETTLPLAFRAVGTTTAFTLRWPPPTLTGSSRLILEDLVTGQRVDLATTDHYSFTATPDAVAPSAFPTLAPLPLAPATTRFLLRLTRGSASEFPPASLAQRLTFELEGRTPGGAPTFDGAATLGFHASASTGWDGWDGAKAVPDRQPYVALAFEGMRDGVPVLKAQESRPLDFGSTLAVPLAFEAAGTGTAFVLRWPEIAGLPETWELVLEDVATGQRIDLRSATSYAFEAEVAGDATTPLTHAVRRFVVHVTVPLAPTIPIAFALQPPAPNPAPGPVTFRYDVPTARDVTLEVLDMLGRRVAVIAEGAAEPGYHATVWNAGALASGLYVVRMRAGTFVQTRRLTVAR